ncbi:MAG: phosphatidylserine/phosphatidylglycerophosphate/cardiolipin synthase family protein [Elusimicrobia bacterium]|nr:phosphatidylserine/phosphatidylglycerophosphate/cardiolipin synthase family protein [Elusimicrobiota bacterium]
MRTRAALASALLVLGPSAVRAGVVASLRALPGAPVPVVALSAPLARPMTLPGALMPALAPALSVPSPLPAAPALAAPARPAAAAPALAAVPAAMTAVRSLTAMGAAIPALQAPSLNEMSLRLSAGAAFDGTRPDPVPAGDPAVDAFVRELLVVLIKAGGDPTKAEAELIDVLARAHAAGRLAPVLQALVADPRVIPHLPPMPAEKRALYAAQFAFMVGAELEGAGRIPGTKPFEPWDDMSRRQSALIAASAFAPRGPGEASLFAEPGFVKEYEALAGAAFTDGNSAKPLIDGPASFKVRFGLMRKAKKSIFIQSWAFYDDATGNAAADLLIARKREGLDVKIMVDGKTTAAHGAAVLARMAAAGVEIVYFNDAARRYDGLHTKILLVDGVHAIVGGMNFGDDYSHMGAGKKWRDTDLYYRGRAAGQTARFMAALWNAQVAAQGLAHGLMGPPSVFPASGKARMSFLADGPEGEATIMLAYLKAIAGASAVINIENAYLITMPQLREALLGALRRGVKVNILTNSAESIDEPIVIAPILASLPELIAAGATVSLKRGDTLHSKFMTVDGLFSIVGSFNLHPRSLRYEHELIVSALDARLAAALDRAFAADMAAALPVTDPAALAIPDSPLNRIVRRYLFNQL